MSTLDFGAGSGSLDWASLEKNLGANITSEKKSYTDDRFWKLSRDEHDNGAAIIRLLPDPSGVPFELVYNHAFQSFDSVSKKKRWFINNSPQTINKPCPASELWFAINNYGTDEAKLEAKNFSRKISFYTNILVVKDPANPENEGKIFLWKFGTKLKDKFVAALNPSKTELSMGEEPKELFHPLKGNNIKLKIKHSAGFLNYDDTTIEPQTSAFETVELAKDAILNDAHLLSQFKEEDSFETYEELRSKMKYVLEAYQPKNMEPALFASLVAPFLATPQAQAQAPQAPVVETPQATAPAPAPEVETPAPQAETPVVEAPAPAGGDLDFLNEL